MSLESTKKSARLVFLYYHIGTAHAEGDLEGIDGRDLVRVVGEIRNKLQGILSAARAGEHDKVKDAVREIEEITMALDGRP